MKLICDERGENPGFRQNQVIVNCLKCDKENPEGSKVCIFCGENFDVNDEVSMNISNSIQKIQKIKELTNRFEEYGIETKKKTNPIKKIIFIGIGIFLVLVVSVIISSVLKINDKEIKVEKITKDLLNKKIEGIKISNIKKIIIKGMKDDKINDSKIVTVYIDGSNDKYEIKGDIELNYHNKDGNWIFPYEDISKIEGEILPKYTPKEIEIAYDFERFYSNILNSYVKSNTKLSVKILESTKIDNDIEIKYTVILDNEIYKFSIDCKSRYKYDISTKKWQNNNLTEFKDTAKYNYKGVNIPSNNEETLKKFLNLKKYNFLNENNIILKNENIKDLKLKSYVIKDKGENVECIFDFKYETKELSITFEDCIIEWKYSNNKWKDGFKKSKAEKIIIDSRGINDDTIFNDVNNDLIYFDSRNNKVNYSVHFSNLKEFNILKKEKQKNGDIFVELIVAVEVNGKILKTKLFYNYKQNYDKLYYLTERKILEYIH